MAMSRSPPTLLFAALSLLAFHPAFAAAAPEEDLVEAQRRTLRQAMRIDCPPAADGEEIVVCGSRVRDSSRFRIAPAPASGAAARAGGEQRAALAADSSRCTTVGPNPQCSGGLPVLAIGLAIARAVARAVEGDD